MRRLKPEELLQIRLVSILREYARQDVVWFAVPNGEKRDKATAAKLWRMGVCAGVADLVFVIDGLTHFVELKAGKGRMSPEQDDFQQDAERAGAVYHCATGMAEAIAVLNRIGACRLALTISDARSDVGMRQGEGAAMPSPISVTERDRARP